jgi:hypothetical protein
MNIFARNQMLIIKNSLVLGLILFSLTSAVVFAAKTDPPIVDSTSLGTVTTTSAVMGGTVQDIGTDPITEVGVEWGTQSATYTSSQTGTYPGLGVPFTVTVNTLSPNTTYYFRAYATNAGNGSNTGTSAEQSFTTPSIGGPPTLISSTLDALSNVTSNAATLGGEITLDGGTPVSTRGIVWNTTGNPTVGVDNAEPMGSDTGTFSQLVSGLTDNGKQFYFRSYAINGTDTGYGPINSFYTEPNNSPATATIDNVGDVSFRINWPANPAGDGDGAIVVVSTNSITAIPTDGTEHAFNSIHATGGTDIGASEFVVYRGTGASSVTVTGLSDTTTYNVAVFYSSGSGGGETGINYRQSTPATTSQQTNTPAEAPTVISPSYASVTSNSAILGGNVSNNGGSPIIERGIDWGEDPGGPYPNNVPMALGTGTGTFSELVTDLTPASTIYFVAYATNSVNKSVSGENSFPTPADLPTVATRAVENITATTADLGGNVTGNGGAAVTEHGIVWNTTNPPETGGTIVPMGSGTGLFISTVGDDEAALPTGVLVYFKAYATNSAGTAYSGVQSFKPAGLPTVTATAATSITHRSAILGGEVTNNGGDTVTARGIVWNTTGSDPTIGVDNVETMGSGTGLFSATVNDLPNGRTIYYRAYATNASGTRYSTPVLSFPTLSEPSLQAANITFTRTAGKSMVFKWDRGNGDGSIVVMRVGSPDITVKPQDYVEYADNPDFTLGEELGGTSGNIVLYQGPDNRVWVNGLDLNTTYSIAIYEYAGTGSFTNYIQLIPAEASRTTLTMPIHNYDNRAECGKCHSHGSWNFLDGVKMKAACVTCHNASGQAPAKLDFDNHVTPGKNPSVDEVSCGMCHEVHLDAASDTQSEHPIDLVTRTNKSFLRANVEKHMPQATLPPAVLHTDQPRRDADNANLEPEATADTPDRAIEGGDASSARGYCQVCHTLTNYHRSTADAAPIAEGDPQCHDGGINDSCGENGIGGAPTTNPAFQVHCGECHEHNNKFQGVGGLTTCTNCHASEAGDIPRPIITTQFDRLTSHVPGGSTVVTQPDCMVCHEQSTHNLPSEPDAQKIRVYDADNGVTFWSQPTKAASTLATGEGEAFAPHCLSCHDDASADSLDPYASDNSTQTDTSPFTGTVPATFATRALDETAWGMAGHNRTVGGVVLTDGVTPITTGTEVTCVGDGQNGCHASGHGTESNFLLASWNAGVGNPATNTPESPNQFCINCHDADGPSSIDAPDQFNNIGLDPNTGLRELTNFRTTADDGAPVNQRHDVFNTPDNTVFPNYTDGDQDYSGGFVTCKDCHSPHADNAERMADPDTGILLPDYDVTNTYTEDGATLNYDLDGAQDPINPEGSAGGFSEPDYIQFCLTCHDGPGNAPPGVVMDSSMRNIADDYIGDYHGAGAGSGIGASINKGGLKVPWVTQADFDAGRDPSAHYAAMNCTTCHGAHGSDNIFNLRSSITVAGVQLEVGGDGAGVPLPARIADPKVYDLPRTTETARNSGIFVQADHDWGAWCSFCHRMTTHASKVETDSCTKGHKHGGGAF